MNPNNLGLLVPDLFEIGGRIYAGRQNQDQRPHNVTTAIPKPPRRRKPGFISKQEGPVTTETTDQAETQQLLDDELAAFVDACPTPERKAELLVKIGFYRTELAKQANMLADVDENLATEVAEEWFAAGDEPLKRAIWNSAAGSEEIPLRKQAPIPAPEQALAKMVEEALNDNVRAHLLHKIGSYTSEYHNMIHGLYGQPDDRVEAVVEAWLTADPAETQLKKNILDAEMPSSGKRIYAQGVQAGDVVDSLAGNASTYAGSKLHGSETNSDGAIKRTIPHRGSGPGGGSRVGNSKAMPGQTGGESPSPGSGTAGPEGGAPNLQPTTVLRRSGTTGGLGSVAGADGGSGAATVQNDETRGASQWNGKKGKKKVSKSDDDVEYDEIEKADFIADLMKIAPDEMVEAILELDEDDQGAAAEIAADHAADLLAWTAMEVPEEGLAKRDVDASVTEWLMENPDQIQLKKWVTEALASAEEIPLDLAQAIIDWEPEVTSRVSVRRDAA